MTWALAALLCAPSAEATVLLSQKEALALAFPGRPPERKTAFLTDEQVRRARAEARAALDSKVWTYYVGVSSAGETSYAYFDTHVVRSETETFMAVVDDQGRLRYVELLAFQEPEDYRPPARWLAQFKGRGLDGDLLVHRAIRNITGASLTSAALTQGVRRVLAVHAVLHPREAPKR